MKQTIHQFDRKLTSWVASTFNQSFRPFFLFMTMLGDPITIGLITVGVITAGFYQSNFGLAISGAMIPLTVIVGYLLKIGFERARPVTEYAMNMKIQTFSFPSGHSSGSTITYGLAAYVALMCMSSPWNIIVCGVLATLPALVGISRVYLGAHFPSDVIAGWTLGILMLSLVILSVRPFA